MASNITVNGVPLEQHIDHEVREEIAEVRVKENKFRKLPIVSKVTGNTSRARSGTTQQASSVKDPRATHVLILGNEFPWLEKFPYTASGKSWNGVLERDATTETIKCHECGDWVSGLHSHVARKHKLSARDYRQRHGFAHKTKLVATKDSSRIDNLRKWRASRTPEELKEIERKRIENARLVASKQFIGRVGYAENANLHARCRAQLTQRTKDLALQLGHTPTSKDLRRARIYLDLITRRFGLSKNEFLSSIGLTPNRAGIYVQPSHLAPRA